MQLKYVNDELFCESNTLLYYVIAYVIGNLLNHYSRQDECVC